MDRLLHNVSKLVDGLNERIARGVFWLMLVVVLIGAFNALARYAGRSLGADLSSNAYLELQWYLFGAIFLLGGAFTLKQNGHVRVDVLYDRLPRRKQGWINVVGHVLFLLPFTLFVVWVSFGPVADSWKRLEVSPDPGGLARYPIKTLIPVAFVLLFLQGVSELIKQVRELREPTDGHGHGHGHGPRTTDHGPQSTDETREEGTTEATESKSTDADPEESS